MNDIEIMLKLISIQDSKLNYIETISEDVSSEFNKFTFFFLFSSHPLRQYNTFKAENVDAHFLPENIFDEKNKYFIVNKKTSDCLIRNEFDFSNLVSVFLGPEETLYSEKISSKIKILFLNKIEIKKILNNNSNQLSDEIKSVLTYKNRDVFNFNFQKNISFILSYHKFDFELPFPDCQKQLNFDFTEFRKLIAPGFDDPRERCQNCGAVCFKSAYKENCCNNCANIKSHIIHLGYLQFIYYLVNMIKLFFELVED